MEKFALEFTLYENNLSVSELLYKYLNQYCSASEFTTEFKRRSHLFVPINKPRYLEKVGKGEIAADGFIWDLEDSIPTEQKQAARDSIKHIPPKPGNVEYNVRINVGDVQELAADIKAIAQFPFDSITLPKGESAAEIYHLMETIGTDKNYIVTIETIKGLNAVDEIASVLRKGKDGLGFGVGDISTDLEVARISTFESPLFQQILGMIALTGKKYGLDLFDSVSAKFNKPENARNEAQLSRHIFGFTGKKLINPKQLEAINSVYSPKLSEIEEHLATLESFLGSGETNAHVVGGEYKGMPAFKKADHKIKKYLRQGYLILK
ncbi:HpcH/HpaI aldolase/citrate lyase family protein [Aphanothece sacrum]|uniref:(3S)-malyl-CoA thiolesterase n=1 Tax=Aphanothece sacrum FPU1 TaxID=1920663 RepID=A0A401IMD6_APHSA|nr:aldolase/citrate lyase family protein [Aphanothece sacrum]GBF82388.1 (3S)-malyl-CoA thiolesterase [Aphanothece sacrum FPU1]GBF84289.1 (3S)-malyl-CoA thiolesterase [Aphanothece sacrum FPU3]